MFSQAEENYLKAIYRVTVDLNVTPVNTNLISEKLETKASSVTDMLKKLANKDLVNYKKYKGVSLTKIGLKVALNIVRKHRLWESFLVNKLQFNWDEVHDIAEQLEHIKSKELVSRLDAFLEFPSHDPHGDPIPDKDGKIPKQSKTLLSNQSLNKEHYVVGIKDSSKEFLQYLEKIKISIGSKIKIISKESFDKSMLIYLNNKEIRISKKTSNNIYIKQKS